MVEESVTEEVEGGFGVESRSVHVMRGGGGRDGDGSVDGGVDRWRSRVE